MTLEDLASTSRAVLTVQEAGELLGLRKSAAYNAAATGGLPTIELNGRRHVPVPALRTLLGLPAGGVQEAP